MESLRFSKSIDSVLSGRDIKINTDGRSGALVAFAGEDLVVKRTQKGGLENAFRMQTFLSRFGLSPKVVLYESGDEYDFLVSSRARGTSAIDPEYLARPRRLAREMGEFLLKIHSLPACECPVTNLTEKWHGEFLSACRRTQGIYKYISDYINVETLSRAQEIVREYAGALQSDTVLHGDYCLPNVMLVDFHADTAIDAGEGGLGDRHFDLFWGLWSLNYNLKTDACREDFLSAYGVSRADEALIRACGCIFLPDTDK